jgi:RND superfamily putative drug exporter
MLKLTRWCIAHRRVVLIGWIVVAVLVTLAAQSAGRNYASNFSLPGTESQRALDLLAREFPQQGGDVDEFVFHVSSGTVASPAVRAAMVPAIAKLSRFPHVVNVISPYSSAGAVQVSKDRRTAFATINYSKRANLLPNATGAPVIALAKSIHLPGVKVAAGGQVIEQAEGFNIGPATTVGVVAALVILLMTFGSLIAAGIPLVTAGLGLITGVALIGLATHVMQISNVSPDLALMIGLGVGIDYALFIVTRFRENYLANGDVRASVLEAMDTSGRAILLAGTTVVIALLGMFATGVSFMYGLAVTSSLTVLLTMGASLTLLPAILSRIGGRLVRKPGVRRLSRGGAALDPESFAAAQASHLEGRSRWREWSNVVQARPWRLAIASFVVMVVLLTPVFALRLETSDAGNDPAGTNTRQAFDMLARGFGGGFNGPLLLVATLPKGGSPAAAEPALAALTQVPDVAALGRPRVSPSGKVAVVQVYPRSAPQDPATTGLVNRLRQQILPPIERSSGITVLVGGFTAGSIDFSHVLSGKLPLFIALVVVLSALLLLVMFRSVVIALQAAAMNLLSIGGALGATVAVFQWGWLGSILGVEKGPVEPWIPVLMFAVVFGLSMDYEVFLVSRVREEWVRRRDASAAVGDGIAFTGRVISAAAAIMICVFLSFMLGNERTLKEFGFGLAAAVFLDALVVRCVMLPAVLELLGPITWRLPRWLDARLPHVNIEGHSARTVPAPLDGSEPDAEPARV